LTTIVLAPTPSYEDLVIEDLTRQKDMARADTCYFCWVDAPTAEPTGPAGLLVSVA